MINFVTCGMLCITVCSCSYAKEVEAGQTPEIPLQAAEKMLSCANADALSRLPLPVTSPLKTGPTELVLLTQHLQDSPVSAEQIREQTAKDPIL